jgi:tetratricopeptide (TPR) repeat protein
VRKRCAPAGEWIHGQRDQMQFLDLRQRQFELEASLILTWVLAGFVCFASFGCRGFVQQKSSSQLVAARQLSLRGAAAMQRSRQQDAEMLFSEALRNSPLDERAHWGYATTLWQRGDRQRAIEHMREAVRLSGLSGGNPEYVVQLGEMSLDVGDLKSAREYALGVLTVNHKNADAWALLGDTHQSERDWPAAEECYNRALLERSDFRRVQLSVAEINRQTGHPKRALAVLDRMADLHASASSDPDVLLSRGIALADLGRGVEAGEALALASERLPVDCVDKQIQLVHAQHRIGELVPARMTLGRLIASNSSNPEVVRLQTMLDMSFAHLSEPGAQRGRNPGMLADQGIASGNSMPNSLPKLGSPNATLIASPIFTSGTSGLLR